MITALGNAIVDILSFVEDDFVNQFTSSTNKGAMLLSDDTTQNQILSQLDDYEVIPGGSICNTINTLAQHGENIETFLLCSVTQDEMGEFFAKSLDEQKTGYPNIFQTGATDTKGATDTSSTTGTSIILITPDGERTMFTNLGCSTNVNLVETTSLDSTEIFLAECYSFDSTNMASILQDIPQLLPKTTIAMGLSDAQCVERNKPAILQYLQHVDILIGNRAEFIELMRAEGDFTNNILEVKPDLAKAIEQLAVRHNISIIVVTDSENDVLLYNADNDGDNKIVRRNPGRIKALDTTGAGDQFAAGFIYAYYNKMPLSDCIDLGIEYAKKVIQIEGARIQLDSTDSLENDG